MDEINSGLYEMYKKNPLSVSADVHRLLLEARIEVHKEYERGEHCGYGAYTEEQIKILKSQLKELDSSKKQMEGK